MPKIKNKLRTIEDRLQMQMWQQVLEKNTTQHAIVCSVLLEIFLQLKVLETLSDHAEKRIKIVPHVSYNSLCIYEFIRHLIMPSQ